MGQPSEDCENDHNGKPGRSSKLAMGLKIAAAGAELAIAGAELVESLGQSTCTHIIIIWMVDTQYGCMTIAVYT